MPETLIPQPPPVSIPPPLSSEEQTTLNLYYGRFKVADKSPQEKIAALQRHIGPRQFFAFGGGETVEMELRSNERVYLLLNAE